MGKGSRGWGKIKRIGNENSSEWEIIIMLKSHQRLSKNKVRSTYCSDGHHDQDNICLMVAVG